MTQAAPDRDRRRREWLVGGLGLLGALAIAAVLLVVLSGGEDDEPGEAAAGDGEVPPSAVAVVEGAPEEVVEIEAFEAALTRAAAVQGVAVPEAGTPQYDPLRDQAMAEALNSAWIAAEAAELGIATPTDAEIDAELDRTVDASFPNRKAFERFVLAQAYCTEEELAAGEGEQCEGLRAQVRTTLLADAITTETLGAADPDAGDPGQTEEAEAFREEFAEKWIARTTCAEAYVAPSCENDEGPAAAPVAPEGPVTP